MPAEPSKKVDALAAMKRVVIYLRVSTVGQVKTDRDAEGFSIPAQREACQRKADSLGAHIVGEYVDAGESARSADRPQLAAMLERLIAERDADYVIVHKVDRLARNRADDVAINLTIRQAGAQLVSVSENIDETPSGMLLHGIMSSIAEFYSRNLATEISKGMTQKAKKGLHPARAPIGYVNQREWIDGHEIRTIAIDEGRASLVSWAFEAYASGDYSLLQLTEALQARGLTTRQTAKTASKPLVVRHVHNLLRNPFYIGIVTWGGVQYPGKHEPIVDLATFATVQAVLESHRRGPEKQRKHNHYLKSTVFCGRCEGRLSFSRSRGHGGEYDYFFCINRHQKRNDCDLPALSAERIEQAIADYYDTITLSDDTMRRLHDVLLRRMEDQLEGAEKRARQQRKRITTLENERRKLLQAYTAGAIDIELLKEGQERLLKQLADAGAALAATEVRWEQIVTNLKAALGLANRFGEAYRRAKPRTRRHLNQAVFEVVYVDTEGVTYARLADPFAQLLADDLLAQLDTDMKNLEPASQVRGSKESSLVEVMGLEPTTSTLRTFPRRSREQGRTVNAQVNRHKSEP